MLIAECSPLLSELTISNVLLPFLDYRSILVADAKLAGEVTPYA